MQVAAKDALDISQETETTQKLYGIDEPATREYGTRCLIARRLVERGVRFVQIFTGNQTWDHHGWHRQSRCRMSVAKTDKPAAALVQRSQTARPARYDAGSLGRRDGPLAGDSE